MHRKYLKEQAEGRLETIISQMKAAEGVREELKATDQILKIDNDHNTFYNLVI